MDRKVPNCVWLFEAVSDDSPALGYSDPHLEYVLDRDASLEGVGAASSQVQDGRERVSPTTVIHCRQLKGTIVLLRKNC